MATAELSCPHCGAALPSVAPGDDSVCAYCGRLQRAAEPADLATHPFDSSDQNKIREALRLHRLWLDNGTGKQADFTDADLTQINFADAHLSKAILVGANLTQVDLTRADLSAADLSGANLTQAKLSKANLESAKLCGANLTQAHVHSASFKNADLSRSNLVQVDFLHADLSGADLSRADLTQADQVDLTGAKFSRATLTQAQYTLRGSWFRRLVAWIKA